MKRLGISISTCDRPEYITALVESLSDWDYDICVCDDGNNHVESLPDNIVHLKTDKPRSGVAVNKNNGLRYLFNNKKCDYVFSMEDDCTVSDLSVFERYVKACETTGIQHFNFGPGSPWNRRQDDPTIIGNLSKRMLAKQTGEPLPNNIIDYGDMEIHLYTHVVGMLSFFSKECIDTVGIYDETYYNAWEHVDHTYNIIKNKMHPPFWYFADIADSHLYIHEQVDEKSNTSLAKDEDEFNSIVMAGVKIFEKKHGCIPGQIRRESLADVKSALKHIYNENTDR